MSDQPDPRIRELRRLIELLEDEGILDEEARSAAAALLGRVGGRKGGLTRARNLSPERRSEIAKRAAEARWAKARSAPD